MNLRQRPFRCSRRAAGFVPACACLAVRVRIDSFFMSISGSLSPLSLFLSFLSGLTVVRDVISARACVCILLPPLAGPSLSRVCSDLGGGQRKPLALFDTALRQRLKRETREEAKEEEEGVQEESEGGSDQRGGSSLQAPPARGRAVAWARV